MINFIIYGDPVPKARPRFARIGRFIRTYTDKKTLIAENSFKIKAFKYKPAKPLEGALKIMLGIYVRIPKTYTSKKIIQAESGTIKPITRPDLDNFIKLILDSMNKTFYKDDNQIVWLNCFKAYSKNPRIEVMINDL